MACPICSSAMEPCFITQVLGKYPAQYEACNACGFLRAHDPHWLDEAYSSAIAAADTGLVMRNIAIACKLAGTLYWVLGERGKGRYLDAAGGYGMLTRLMRDLGFDFYWADKYCDNQLARGFEYGSVIGSCRAVTAMEVMEHLTDPAAFIKETLAFSGAQTLVFTTELYEGVPPQPGTWWYYAFATGQHVGFFQRRTLEKLAAQLGLRFASANGIHVLSRTAINERLLGVVTGRWASRIAPWWIRRRLGSKTMMDHELMLRKIG
ncbi:MAG TPA: class I SAM-dependent methyltransferase [Dissulfurispiraceae bacterium]|nr:class I SAM-dependent methyltransferase [Dissulfurispiraceae bacterium]